MTRRVLCAVAIAVLAMLPAGCATLADAKAGNGTGVSRMFDAPPEAIYGAMPGVLKEAGLDFVGDNRQEGYILAQRGITPFSYGEHVAIFVETIGNRTRVEVVSKKAM